MNNFNDIFSKEDISLLATYIQMDAPVPPEMSIDDMKERRHVFVETKDYPPSLCMDVTGKTSSWLSSVTPVKSL